MTQIFLEDGTVIPATAVEIPHIWVTQVKDKTKDGYFGVQVSCEEKKNLSKPQKGHFRGLGSFRFSREFSLTLDVEKDQWARGQELDFTKLEKGMKLQVIGNSKGRGFQGVVRRHHFHGSPASHGHKDQLRMPGSIGAGGVQNVKKGKRMAGHMGGQQVTIKNVQVVDVDLEKRIVFLKGALPGAKNGLLKLQRI